MGFASDFPDDGAFRAEVDLTLRRLVDQADAIESDDLDVRLSEGNLAIAFESGGTFMISQQTPVHELWLSANLTAWHFKHSGGRWVERDSGEAMADVIGRLVSERVGAPVRFEL